MKKNILILYTNYGTGHYMAAKAIEEHIVNNYLEYNVYVFDPLSYSRPLINKVFAIIGKIVATRLRWFRRKFYGKKMYKNYLKNSVFFKLCIWLFWTKKLEKKLLEFDPSIIISTQVGPTGLIAEYKEKLGVKLISIFTDYGIHRMYTVAHEFIDLFCLPSNEMKNQMIELGINEEKLIVTGIPVRSSFLVNDKIDKDLFISKYKLLKDKPVFLFVCGGGLGYDNAFSYFEELLKFDYDFSYIFVSGKNEALFTRANALVNKYQKAGKVLGYVENIDELMKYSDVVFGKPGGIITSETLNLGVPLCAIEPIPGQEINNALYIVSNKFGFYVKDIKDFKVFLSDIKSGEINIKDYSKNIIENFKKFSFIDIDKL